MDRAGETLREVELYIPDGFNLLGRNDDVMAVSRDGQYVAYVAQEIADTYGEVLIVFDVFNQAVAAEAPIPDGNFFRLGRDSAAAFDVANTYLYYSLESRERTGWRIERMQLNGTRPTVPELVLDRNDHERVDRRQDGVRIEYVDSDVVYYSVGRFTRTMFVWQDDEIEASSRVRYEASDVHLNQPVFVSAIEDTRFENTFAYIGLGQPTNVVDYWDPATEVSRQIFTEADIQIWTIGFAEHGAKVMMLVEVMTENTTTTRRMLYLADLNGNLLEAIDDSRMRGRFFNVQNGVVYSSREGYASDVNGYAIRFIDTTGEGPYQPQTLVELDFGRVVSGTVVAWVGVPGELPSASAPMPQQTLVPPQVAVAIATATPSPISTMAPTVTPIPPSLFTVGDEVQVVLPPGDALNLRVDPTTAANVLRVLQNGAMLTLLEGPVEAEGLFWWRVRADDGAEGWTVEGVVE
ncbi:MAG: SH3 domain-containing protein, partial [Chloroflexota bacterium]